MISLVPLCVVNRPLSVLLLGSSGSTETSWEHHIRADLLNNYDRKVRPVLKGKKVAEVSFALRVSRLVRVVRKSLLFLSVSATLN